MNPLLLTLIVLAFVLAVLFVLSLCQAAKRSPTNELGMTKDGEVRGSKFGIRNSEFGGPQ